MHSSWKSRGGGGPWIFWQILLRGVLGVVRKSVGVVFIAFLCGSFTKSLKGVHEGPPPPPLCASMISKLLFLKGRRRTTYQLLQAEGHFGCITEILVKLILKKFWNVYQKS